MVQISSQVEKARKGCDPSFEVVVVKQRRLEMKRVKQRRLEMKRVKQRRLEMKQRRLSNLFKFICPYCWKGTTTRDSPVQGRWAHETCIIENHRNLSIAKKEFYEGAKACGKK